jgi:hypothetical protein
MWSGCRGRPVLGPPIGAVPSFGLRSFRSGCGGDAGAAKPAGLLDHHAGAIATRAGQVELIEVDLTPNTVHRYKMIRHNHASRLTHEGVARIRYFCTAVEGPLEPEALLPFEAVTH